MSRSSSSNLRSANFSQQIPGNFAAGWQLKCCSFIWREDFANICALKIHVKCTVLFIYVYGIYYKYMYFEASQWNMDHFKSYFLFEGDGTHCQPCCHSHGRFFLPPRNLCAKLGIYTSPAFISSSVAVCPLFSWYRADFSGTFVGHGGFDVATFWPEIGGGWDAPENPLTFL